MAADTVRVNITIPATEYDRIYRIAQRRGVSIPEEIRRRISVLNIPASAQPS